MKLSFIKNNSKVIIKPAELLNDIKYCTLVKTVPYLQMDSDASEDYASIHGYFYLYSGFVIKFIHILHVLLSLNLSYMIVYKLLNM